MEAIYIQHFELIIKLYQNRAYFTIVLEIIEATLAKKIKLPAI